MAFAESLAKRALAACKIEASYNEDPVLTPASDAFLTFDSAVTWSPDIQMTDEQVHSPSFTQRKQTPGQRLANQELTFLLQGGTGAGVPDKHAPLIRSCGIHEAVVASTSCTYTPATRDQLVSAKLGVEHDGWVFETAGLFGTFVMSATVNGAIRVRYRGRGKYKAPTNTTYSTWAGGAKRALPFQAASFTLTNGTQSLTPAIAGFEFDRGINIDMVDDGNAADGLGKTYIAEARPTFTIDIALNRTPGSELNVSHFLADLIAQTTHDVGFTIAGAAGNTIAFDFPQLQVIDARPVRVRNHRGLRVTYWVQHGTDGSEFSWVIT